MAFLLANHIRISRMRSMCNCCHTHTRGVRYFHHWWLAKLTLTLILVRLFALIYFLFLKFPSLCMEWFRFLAAWLWKLPKGVKELQNHGISHLTTLNRLSCTYPCSVKPQWKTSWRNHLKWYHDKLLKALLPWNRTFALICSWQVTSEY